MYVVLRAGYEWLEGDARPVPGQREKRMLPLSWGLNFMSPESRDRRVARVRKIVAELGDGERESSEEIL